MNAQEFWEILFGLIGGIIVAKFFFSIFDISKYKKRQVEIEEDRLRATQKTNELLAAIQKELHKHNELLEKKYSNSNTNYVHTNQHK